MNNIFVWVDIPVMDLERATAFYAAVSGLEVGILEGEGFRFSIFPSEPGAVSGCLYVPKTHSNAPSRSGPLAYLNVDGRMTEAQAAVTAHGGSIEEAAQPIGAHGFRALIIDSEGNRIALHSRSL